MGQDVPGVRQGPLVRQQSEQYVGTRIHGKLQDHVMQLGPGLEPMTLDPRDDCAQYRVSARNYQSCRVW
jgi:hypothetical protein